MDNSVKGLLTWLNVDNTNGCKYRESAIKKYSYSIYKNLIHFTDNLELNTFQQKLFHYVHNLDKIPVCDNGFSFKFISFKVGYSKMCIHKCNACNKSVYDIYNKKY